MGVTISEIKKNLQGTNSEGEESRIQVNDLEHKEEISIQPEQQEEKRILKNEDSVRSLWDNFKHTNIRITEVLEAEEKETENLFEKIMNKTSLIW